MLLIFGSTHCRYERRRCLFFYSELERRLISSSSHKLLADEMIWCQRRQTNGNAKRAVRASSSLLKMRSRMSSGSEKMLLG